MIWRPSKLLLLFKLHVNVFEKMLLIFVIFANIFKVMYSFDGVSTNKHPNIVTDPLNRCGVLQTCLIHSEYIFILRFHIEVFQFHIESFILRFSTKWLIKIRFGDFRILLWLGSLFTIFTFKKLPKVVTGLWKGCGIRKIYFFCRRYMIKFSTKLVFYIIYC